MLMLYYGWRKIRHEDEYTAEHCLNVCILAIAFGRQLGFSEVELHNLGLCDLLHDVGKMRVPSDILNKPAKLTEREFKLVKAHTIHGSDFCGLCCRIFVAYPGNPAGLLFFPFNNKNFVI